MGKVGTRGRYLGIGMGMGWGVDVWVQVGRLRIETEFPLLS